MTEVAYDRKLYYRGDKASSYDASRIGPRSAPLARFRWHEEMCAIQRIAAAWPRSMTVLDSPCGTGRFLPVMAQHGHRVIGMDISRDMLRATPTARKQGGARLLRGDIESLPLQDGAVDMVVAMRVWSFLPDAVRLAALTQWRRIARRAIFLQVRFRCDGIEAPPPEAVTAAATRFTGTDAESIHPDQRANWPTPRQFGAMAQQASLTILKFHAIDWGPTNDPVFIVELVSRARRV